MLRTIAVTIAAVLALGVAGPASADSLPGQPNLPGTVQPGTPGELVLCDVPDLPCAGPPRTLPGQPSGLETPAPSPSCKWKVKRHKVRACRAVR